MRIKRPHRPLGAAAVAASVALLLTGCIPPPPALPQQPAAPSPSASQPLAPSAQPSETGGGPEELGAEAAVPIVPDEILEGELGADGSASLTLEIAERSAIALAATSQEGEDLMLRLTGGDIDLQVDDESERIDAFAFRVRLFDPVIATVLDPGTYVVEVTEYSGDPTGFRLHLLAGSSLLAPGERLDAPIEPGSAAVVIVGAGASAVGATSELDTVLRIFDPASIETFDDDGGAGLNPRLELDGPTGEDVAMVVWAYDREASGTATITAE